MSAQTLQNYLQSGQDIANAVAEINKQFLSNTSVLIRIQALAKQFPSHWRKGQKLMNALAHFNKNWLWEITTNHPEADCFYSDEKIPAFKEWIASHEPIMTLL